MALRFLCSNCQNPIFVKHLKKGETAKCKNCGAFTAVPQDAEEVGDSDVPATDGQVRPAASFEAIMTKEEEARLLEEMEKEASSNPQSVAKRAILALGLMIGFYALALGIAAILLLLAYAQIRFGERIYVKLVIICIAGGVTILWSVLPRWDRFSQPGPLLDRNKHPHLFGILSEIAQASGQQMPAEVYLVPEFNAWVANRGGVMGFGSRRVMGIGLPLLQTFSVSQFKAVIAHEFGHYHQGDTRLGPWIYKTRSAVGRTLQNLRAQNSILQAPFAWYGRNFMRITQSVSRRQEYVADQIAAKIAGARPLIDGLKLMGSYAAAFAYYWHNEVIPIIEAGFRPPISIGYSQFLSSETTAANMAKIREEDLNRKLPDPYDSHPSLWLRISALEKLPSDGPAQINDRAISLIDELDSLEQGILKSIFRHEFVDKLKFIKWGDVIEKAYYPLWQAAANENRELLSGTTPAMLPAVMKNPAALLAKIPDPRTGKATEDQKLSFLIFIIGASLAVRLKERGWNVLSNPGEKIRCVNDGSELRPFELVAQLWTNKLDETTWHNCCVSAGISDIDLGSK